MKKNLLAIFLVVIFAVSVLIIFSKVFVGNPRPTPVGKFSSFSVGTTTIQLEIADTSASRTMGLSGKTHLPSGSGMLFVFDHPDYYTFWMKDMKFPIDIIWIDENRQIVHIEKEVAPETYPKSFRPSRKSLYVLEVEAGLVRENNISIGN